MLSSEILFAQAHGESAQIVGELGSLNEEAFGVVPRDGQPIQPRLDIIDFLSHLTALVVRNNWRASTKAALGHDDGTPFDRNRAGAHERDRSSVVEEMYEVGRATTNLAVATDRPGR